MGVFVTGRQVALEIDMPGWWLANASVDMDFRNGRYYDSTTYPQFASGLLSCTRASVGYAKTNAGALTSFTSNALRITDLGLLVEDARTNLCINSDDFSSWTDHSGTTITSNVTAAPDGTTTADKSIPNASNNPSGRFRSITGSGQSTWSVYAKAAGYNFASLGANCGSDRYAIVVNLTTGAITATNTIGSPTGIVTSVETLANGWFRLIITLSNTAAEIAVSVSDVASPSFSGDGFGFVQMTGNGSSGVYFWGAQVEAGAFPSSYIPTTGSTATRAAENITTSGSLQTAINAATGSLVAQTDNGGGGGFAANIVDSNGTNLLGCDASNHALASMIGTLATANTANRTTQDKLGLAWNPSGRSLVLNGGTVATDASAQTPSATQHIGSSGTANFAFAYIERLSAWTTKLADATLQGFTV